MIASRRLTPLLRRAEHHKDAAARQFAERQRQLQLNQHRLDELGRYAAEYTVPPATCCSIGQLRSQHAFIDRLFDAVERQRQRVNHSRQNLEHERQSLIHASHQQKVLEHLDTLSRNAEQMLEQRRQQRELDDLGARITTCRTECLA